MPDPSLSPLQRSPEAGRDPRLGVIVDGRYRIEAVLSTGRLGVIFRAAQLPLERRVVIKVMDLALPSEGTAENAAYQQRFLNEASALSKLQSPFTVRLFDFGFWNGSPYLVMEYLQGETLHSLIRRSGPLSPRLAVRIAEQVCRSLHEAHDVGVVHRDLQPNNIFLVDDPSGGGRMVKVLDFGLVKELGDDSEITGATQWMGSHHHSAPEQLEVDVRLDGRADQYALGVVLFEMITGRLPFLSENVFDVMTAKLNKAAPRIEEVAPDEEFPGCLSFTVDVALARRPQERFANMMEFRRALQACSRAVVHDDWFSVVLTRTPEGRIEGPRELWASSRSLSESMSMSISHVPVARPIELPPVITPFQPMSLSPSGPPEPAPAHVLRSWSLVVAAVGLVLVLLAVWGLVVDRDGWAPVSRAGQRPAVSVDALSSQSGQPSGLSASSEGEADVALPNDALPAIPGQKHGPVTLHAADVRGTEGPPATLPAEGSGDAPAPPTPANAGAPSAADSSEMKLDDEIKNPF